MKPRWWIVGAIQDLRLSAEARALLVFLGTRPAGWRYSVEECSRYLVCGRQKFQKVLREVKERGYVEIHQPQDRKGRLRLATLKLHDKPRVENQPTVAGSPRDDFKASGPRAENQPSRARVMRAGARSLSSGMDEGGSLRVVGGRDA